MELERHEEMYARLMKKLEKSPAEHVGRTALSSMYKDDRYAAMQRYTLEKLLLVDLGSVMHLQAYT